jgi:hypothetical protein
MALVALGLGLSAGCDSLKGPEISVTADTTTIAAGGFEYATITAEVRNHGKPARGVQVEFDTDLGSFSDSSDLTYTEVASDEDGLAVVRLYSPMDQGQTDVEVRWYDDESGLEATDYITINFGPPTAGNLPVDGRFHLNCPFQNLGALRQPMPPIEMHCTISAQTTNGNNVPTDALNLFFKAEAGILEAFTDPWADPPTIIRYRVQGGTAMPVDVDPTGGEPSRTGTLGETHNPRDGVVSLLAVTEGSEAWTDLNANGVRDDNEPFEDIGEPILDVDDDGVYTEGVDDFWDTNNNGQWDGPNGQYDESTMIAAQAKVVWTGELEEAPDAGRLEHEPVSTDILNNGSMTLFIYLLDRNMNPVAAFTENYDYLELLDNSGYLEFTPADELDLTNETGMQFDADGLIQQFLPDAGMIQLTVRDYYPTTVEDPVVPYAIDVSFWVTAGPIDESDFTTQEHNWFSYGIEGTVQ